MNVRLFTSLALASLLATACSSLPQRGTDAATVSIGQPTVYMRERSLIERFEDLEWLRLQRSPEKEKEYEQGFQGSATTATAEFTGLALKASIGQVLAKEPENPGQPLTLDDEPAPAPTTGSGATDSGTTPTEDSGGDSGDTGDSGDKKDDGAKDEPAPADVFAALNKLDDKALGDAFDKLNKQTPNVSPRDKLVNRIAFRDAVSEAIRESSLDDVHDLNGMALYEVQFDLSIVGGEDAGQAYAVMLEVENDQPGKISTALAAGVVEVLRANCLADIEETAARMRADRVTVGSSIEVPEARERGAFGARHASMLSILDVMELVVLHQKKELEELKEKLTRLGHLRMPTPELDSERRGAEGALSVLSAQLQQDVTKGWRKALITWNGAVASTDTVRDNIASCEKIDDVRTSLAPMSTKSSESLRELALRQRSLAELSRSVRDIFAALADLQRADQRSRKQSRAPQPRNPQERQQWQREDADCEESITAFDQERSSLDQRTDEYLQDTPMFLAVGPVSVPVQSLSIPTLTDRSAPLEALLGHLREKPILDQSTADALQSYLDDPDPILVTKSAERALGFLVARSYGKTLNPFLVHNASVPVNGFRAEVLLNSLLTIGDLASWSLPQRSPRVVSVTPTEVAEQITTSAYSDVRRAFSLALEGVFRGTIATANADFQHLFRELRRYELIGRNSLLVGFVGGDVSSGTGSNTFGWIMSPRLETSTEGRATLRYRQGASHYPVTATLIAPASLGTLHLSYRVFRITNDGEWLETRAFPEGDEKTRESPLRLGPQPALRTPHRITVDLPVTPDAIAQGIMSDSRWSASVPKVVTGRPFDRERGWNAPLWRLQSEEKKSSLVILGSNLWRNPQVYVGGQRAKRVQILSDLGGLWAEFEDLPAPPGADGKPALVDLVVSTSRGSDRLVDAVEILPPKSKAKEPEPKFAPPLQVVAAKVATKDGKEIATVSLRFELVPPLPKAWNTLTVRARPKGAAEYLYNVPVAAQNVINGETPGSFELRDLEFRKEQGLWKPSELFEVTLQLTDRPGGDPRYLHPSPVEVVFVRQPVDCKTGDKLSGTKGADDVWRLSADSSVELTTVNEIDAAQLVLLLPLSKEGSSLSATATLGDETPAAVRVSAKRSADRFVWVVAFPKGTVLGKQIKDPVKLTVAVDSASFEVKKLSLAEAKKD